MSTSASNTSPDPDFANELDSNAPPEFLCPITMSLMKDPVLMPDGQTYEREAIQMALRVNPISPVTRKPMSMDQAITNYALKNLIEKYIEDKKAEKGSNTNSQPQQPSPPQSAAETSPVQENPGKNEKSQNEENQRFNRNLRELTAMGFDEQESRNMLNQTQNDLQTATTLLVNKRKKNSEKNRRFQHENSYNTVDNNGSINQNSNQKKEILFFIIAILFGVLVLLFSQ